MKVTVCIGSCCHLKGSRPIIERLRQRIAGATLEDKIELSSVFCLGKCQDAVSVSVGEEFFSVSPETADAFFDEILLAKGNA